MGCIYCECEINEYGTGYSDCICQRHKHTEEPKALQAKQRVVSKYKPSHRSKG